MVQTYHCMVDTCTQSAETIAPEDEDDDPGATNRVPSAASFHESSAPGMLHLKMEDAACAPPHPIIIIIIERTRLPLIEISSVVLFFASCVID